MFRALALCRSKLSFSTQMHLHGYRQVLASHKMHLQTHQYPEDRSLFCQHVSTGERFVQWIALSVFEQLYPDCWLRTYLVPSIQKTYWKRMKSVYTVSDKCCFILSQQNPLLFHQINFNYYRYLLSLPVIYRKGTSYIWPSIPWIKH